MRKYTTIIFLSYSLLLALVAKPLSHSAIPVLFSCAAYSEEVTKAEEQNERESLENIQEGIVNANQRSRAFSQIVFSSSFFSTRKYSLISDEGTQDFNFIDFSELIRLKAPHRPLLRGWII